MSIRSTFEQLVALCKASRESGPRETELSGVRPVDEGSSG